VVTAVLASLAAATVLGLPWQLAAVFGCLLTVSGPTVVLPLVRHVRPKGATGPILRWEGIIIDPIGATLAVLAFEAVKAGSGSAAASDILLGVFRTVLIGGGLGLVAGLLMEQGIRRYLIPDFLQNPVSLAMAVGAYGLADTFQKESGLLATTIMGMYLANQRHLETRHILEFKENLRVLLISTLFVVLAARLQPEQIGAIGWPAVVFVGLLILVIRPLAVAASTVGSSLGVRERVFLACVAPRGIVAAAVAPVLAADLAPDFPQAQQLVPLMFAVIIGTVLVYGLMAGPMAHRLGLSDSNPQGVLILGGQPWARALASTLRGLGVRTLVVDTNEANVLAAQAEGLEAFHGSILSESAFEDIDLTGIGRLLALTANDQVNTLAAQRMAREFGSAGVYQLLPKRASDNVAPQTAARLLADGQASYARLAGLWARRGGRHCHPVVTRLDHRRLPRRPGRGRRPPLRRQRRGQADRALPGSEPRHPPRGPPDQPGGQRRRCLGHAAGPGDARSRRIAGGTRLTGYDRSGGGDGRDAADRVDVAARSGPGGRAVPPGLRRRA
jgi:NhaP-type Na+/H+ or K+/H+ antiporter